MIVKLLLDPLQPLATGVTVIVATTGVLPVLIAEKVEMFPVPLVPKPIDDALLLQLNTVPVTPPIKFTPVVLAPLHTV